MSPPIHESRRRALDEALRAHRSLLVAFSGGVDSSALLVAAVRALGVDAVLAVTADSPSFPESDRRDAEALARALGVKHRFVPTHEMANPLYVANDANRCYHCKTELFSVLEPLRAQYELDAIAYGENADDAADFRPGRRAARERGVAAPLAEVGFTKDDARALLADEGFTTLAVKPASACLASRVPTGTPVEESTLARIGACEEFLRSRGYRVVRVRHHDAIARLELDGDGIVRAASEGEREEIARYFRTQGYAFVAVDLTGYRMGSVHRREE